MLYFLLMIVPYANIPNKILQILQTHRCRDRKSGVWRCKSHIKKKLQLSIKLLFFSNEASCVTILTKLLNLAQKVALKFVSLSQCQVGYILRFFQKVKLYIMKYTYNIKYIYNTTNITWTFEK